MYSFIIIIVIIWQTSLLQIEFSSVNCEFIEKQVFPSISHQHLLVRIWVGVEYSICRKDNRYKKSRARQIMCTMRTWEK